SYDVKELAVENTELSVSDAKKQARDNVISAYNNIFNLEQQYQSKSQDIAAAEETLNTAKLKYEMGTANQGDVLKAEADLANLQQTLKSTAYEHELAEISFDKPWIN
ncbi:MAG: TolC family protein, partial [Syntrophomonas sp.]